MGSCAGCSAPQRSLRDNNAKREKIHNTSLQHAKTQEDQPSFNRKGVSKKKPKLDHSLDVLFNQSPQKAWKSRIVTKTIKQYIKPTTLKEEENSSSHYKSSIIFQNVLPLARGPTLRTQSLDQSIQARRVLSPKAYKQKYGNQQLFDSEIDQRSADGAFENSGYYAPRNQISIITEFNPNNEHYEQLHTESLSLSKTTLTLKAQRQKERQLDQILEIMEQETQTPGYVRQIKTKCGQDIKSNNFGKMQPIAGFPQFNARQYLDQIQA